MVWEERPWIIQRGGVQVKNHHDCQISKGEYGIVTTYQVMYPKLLGKTGQVQSEMPFKNCLQEIFYKLEMRNINRAAVNFRPTGFQMHRRWARRSG